MGNSAAIIETLTNCLDNSRAEARPYPHWLLKNVFPDDVCDTIRELPLEPPVIEDTLGKRETHNTTRTYFSVGNRTRFDVCRSVAEALQDGPAVRKLETICGIALAGKFLRIEYCQDTDGFWLEPHTDIGAKVFSMLVYLSKDPGSETWGTDVLDENLDLVATAPYTSNCGLIFIPAANTWHGFHKRPINGVRKSIIVNYVKDEWRARHELAYPDCPVS